MSNINPPPCPLCPGRGVVLGRLGRATWYRCRDCGMVFRHAPRIVAACMPQDWGAGRREAS